MKKKGILLLGSLALMVVAMVFIAVTVVSRSSVTPETSDAATIKKDTSLPLPENVSYQIRNLEFDKSSLLYASVWGINDNGYVIGDAYGFVNDSQVNKSYIWDNKGKTLTLPTAVRDDSYFVDFNNENVVLMQNYPSSLSIKGYVYDVNTSKLTELAYKPAVVSKSTTPKSKISISDLQRKSIIKQNSLRYPGIKPLYNFPQDTCGIDCYEYIYPNDINDSSDVVAETEKGLVLWTNAGKANQKYYYLNDLLNSSFKITGYRVASPRITNRITNSITIVSELHSITTDESEYILYDFDVVKGTLSNLVRVTSTTPLWYGSTGRITDSKQFAFMCSRNLSSANKPLDVNTTLDTCYLSKNDNYKTVYSLTSELDKISPRGITYLQGSMSKDGNFMGRIASEKSTSPYNEDYFVYNPKKNEYLIMDNLVKQKKILNMPTTGFIFPSGVNVAGDVAINYMNNIDDPNTSAIGVLIPYNRPANTKTTK